VALDARGLVALHSIHLRPVLHLVKPESRDRGVVGDLHSGRDRLAPAAGGGVQRKTCWSVDSRLSRWCRVASTVISQRALLLFLSFSL
jgi:hypothetical protein